MSDFSFQIKELKSKYPTFSGMQDYHTFIALCIKNFFFNDDTTKFDPDKICEYIVDGANDGGIDALFNDETSENNDIVLIQSKYYTSSDLKDEDIAGELFKICQTLDNLKNNKISSYNDSVVSAYRNATANMEDGGSIKIFFFTSYEPSGKRERNKLEKDMRAYFKDYDFEFISYKDIENQIEVNESGKAYVESDKLIIDKKDNCLKYGDSIIVNISAQSLQDLENRRRNSLLGMNLRYYNKQKTVDSGIEKTISDDPTNFWYKNNGVIIVCDDYSLDGNVLKLINFSIINGGQTTNRIGHCDINEDFFLQCKVVKIKGDSQEDKDKFALSIAEASNAQKAIKKADLKANTVEQINLRERLNKCGVYYITKKGDKAPKQYVEPYEIASLEQVGKASLAGVLLMPGSARSNSARMYQDEYYYSIFGKEAKPKLIADLLKISYYYDLYTKTEVKNKGFDETTVIPMIRNGKTFQLASIAFLCKIINGEFDYDKNVAPMLNDTDSIKRILKQTDNTTSLIKRNYDDEKEKFFVLFDKIGEEVLGYCYSNALDTAKDEQKSIAASDFLKSDANFYKYVIKRLWSRYNKDTELKTIIDGICTKES